ncbi:MAG TPA: VOC family protein [Terracidiphilus sp.]|nr:VOC family protein [Terracidiphilus sp.]
MIRNRSVPTDTLLPHIVYNDLSAAVAWLTRAFGYVEHYRYGNPMAGSQGFLGNACIMLVRSRDDHYRSPLETGYGTQSLTVFLEEVETHYARAKAAGAKILEEPHETVYGEFQYAAVDLEGHRWLFSRHATDRDPASWGATVF